MEKKKIQNCEFSNCEELEGVNYNVHSKYYLCKYGLAPVIISISCLSLHFPNLFQLTDIEFEPF